MSAEPKFADPATQECFERQKQIARAYQELRDLTPAPGRALSGVIYNLTIPEGSAMLRQGATVEIPLEDAFPTLSPEKIAELRRPLNATAPLYVTAIDYEKKTVTLGSKPVKS